MGAALHALTIAAVALASSCDQPTAIRTLAPWMHARDAGAEPADAGAEPADAGPDSGPDAGSNAFDRQKPQPKDMIVEYSFKPHRFLPAHTTERDVTRFLDGLKTALKQKDRAALAAAMNYPLIVVAARTSLVVDDPDAFLAHYDRIMTPAVVASLRSANVGNVQIPARGVTLGSGSNRLTNYVGMSVGNGRIWFDLAEVNPPPVTRRQLLIRIVNAGASAAPR